MATPILLILAMLIAVPLAIVAMVYLVVPIFRALGWLVAHVCRFVFREVGDTLRVVGGVVTGSALIPLTVLSVIIGRWSAAAHYGRAIESEVKAVGGAVYRIVIGHPARLLGLGALTEGIEHRLPEVVAAAPGGDRPPRRAGQFEGYRIVGSLQGGGSGGKLYIAEPTPEKLASFARQGAADVSRVVIKCFSLRDGSSLPQIVRENRALPAAKRLGLILEHELTEERFHYVMRYVAGESLGLVTSRLHAVAGPEGLDAARLRDACEYGADLLRTLCHYHSGGLWHKDVKPDNIIVSTDGQAHLVDFGLITPLRSSMTLTTHGTEYFRDPEMVRLALRGVKVHEVDGAKFDIYAAGAVLYSVIENSFPAHGGLSQITRRCPEALRWIVRRAMTEYDKRYASAAAMLGDVETVLAAPDPFALRPVDLPSFRADQNPASAARPEWDAAVPAPVAAAVAHAGPALGAPASPVFAPGPQPSRPNIRVTSWWTGRYAVDPAGPGPGSAVPHRAAPVRHSPERVPGLAAAEQLARARERARTARARAQARMKKFEANYAVGVNRGVGLAVLVFLSLVAATVISVVRTGGVGDGVSVVYDMPDGTLATGELGGGNGLRVRVSAPADRANSAGHRTPGAAAVPAAHRRGADESEFFSTVMVLRDAVALEPAGQRPVDAQVAGLQESGFSLRGEAATPGDAAVSETETELAAELRHAIGLSPFGSSDAALAIRGWLGEHPDFGSVVWFGRSSDAEPEAWVVARDGLGPDAVDDVVEALQSVSVRR